MKRANLQTALTCQILTLEKAARAAVAGWPFNYQSQPATDNMRRIGHNAAYMN